ncbi:ABC transporter permease [Nitratiruptor sp. SB155-2]|uniref:ABC transporter permease n=1 Tax=Nitratiruptor sp. (strain SB155-2) TaxID=387092 RepID=UPI0001586EE3|nr:ABC transporter permease [Nitratiruptor sp. SB155-2]BAF69230.1 ABC transporter, permease [Nitratiruptor sp. SB155-2]
MINLALKDIAHAKLKFIVTAMGLGMLLGIVLIMIGVYRGLIIDAQVLLDDIGADLWIVQENSLGPFAQSSRIHEDLKNTLKVQEGIQKTAALAFMGFQIRTPNGQMKRIYSVGYDPFGEISPINPKRIIAGRAIQKKHYEVVVTDKLGFQLGDKIPMGRDIYTVVGITKGTVSSGGEPLIYLSLADAQKLQFLYSNPRIRNDRARGLNVKSDSHLVNAVVATLKPGFDPKSVAQKIERWKHVSVYTDKQQRWILTVNVIEMARKQIGMFTVILIAVSTIIIALIIYTMTLEKIKEISIMKLIGIPNSMIVKMIMQETLILGILAFIFANIFAHTIYDKFPKRVVLQTPDAWGLFGVVLLASFLASLFGVYKALKADERQAIGG